MLTTTNGNSFKQFFLSLKFRSNLAENVDVRNLTWEQKEKVLRLLFTRMNNEKAKSLAPSGASEPLLSIDDKPLE